MRDPAPARLGPERRASAPGGACSLSANRLATRWRRSQQLVCVSTGTSSVPTSMEAAKRQSRLQEVESKLEPIPFDVAAVRSYGLVVAAVVSQARKPQSRFADLLIAATAHANRLDLYTRNGDDFAGLKELVQIVSI